MNLKQYKIICMACDRILNIASDNDSIVSIPILHVIREHPEFVKKYNFIYPRIRETKSKSIKKFNKIISLIKSTLFDYKIHNIPYNFDQDSEYLIIVSHITNQNQSGNTDDEYFGSLHNKLLLSSKIKPVILLINHTSISSKKLSIKFEKNRIDRIVLPKSSGLFNELRMFLTLSSSIYRFTRSITINDSISTSLLNAISQPKHFLKSMPVLRIGFFVERLVKFSNAKFIITTYEGHASERIIFSRARKANNKILCFAFQNSILNKYQHSLTRNIHEKYNPDHIFCCGDITNDILSKCNSLNGIKTSVLGSPNGSPVNIFSRTIDINQQLTFLILPEAFKTEYKIFLSLILNYAEAFPDYKFIWRSHPALDLENLNFFKKLILPSNIIISYNTFDDDLQTSDIALYRGSSAIIRATVGGLIPIYLKVKDEIGIDIMHDLNINRVSSISELRSCIHNSNFSLGNEKTFKFCKDYFKPLDSELFVQITNQFDK